MRMALPKSFSNDNGDVRSFDNRPSFLAYEPIHSARYLALQQALSNNMYTSPSMHSVTCINALSFPVRMTANYSPVILPPPPYVSVAGGNGLLPPPPYSPVYRDSSESDIDVVGLTDGARDVNLSDDDDSLSKDEPLDLSLKKRETRCSTSCAASTSQIRPTVIKNGYVGKNTDMRRSASSVTSRPVADVSDHFRRSLSGKWPRRQSNINHYKSIVSQADSAKSISAILHQRKSNNSPVVLPIQRKISPLLSPNVSSAQQIIVNNSGIEIEEHFRKALGAEAYEQIRKNQGLSS